MTWELDELTQKHYTTTVRNTKTDERLEVCTFKFDQNYRASDRELESGWTDWCGFDHVELQRGYEMALVIRDALNEWDKHPAVKQMEVSDA